MGRTRRKEREHRLSVGRQTDGTTPVLLVRPQSVALLRETVRLLVGYACYLLPAPDRSKRDRSPHKYVMRSGFKMRQSTSEGGGLVANPPRSFGGGGDDHSDLGPSFAFGKYSTFFGRFSSLSGHLPVRITFYEVIGSRIGIDAWYDRVHPLRP